MVETRQGEGGDALRHVGVGLWAASHGEEATAIELETLIRLDLEVSFIVDAVVGAARLCDEARDDAVEGYSVVVTCARGRVSVGSGGGRGGEGSGPSRQSCTKLGEQEVSWMV